MKEIQLTSKKHKFLVKVDDEDFSTLSKFKWHYHKFPTGSVGGYARRSFHSDGKVKHMLMHRQIINAQRGYHTDHINGDGLDNQKSNLRICNRSQNLSNRKMNKNNTSGIKGVAFNKKIKKWSAQIQSNNINHNIGFYDNSHDAMIAYDAASRVLHRQFSRNNQNPNL